MDNLSDYGFKPVSSAPAPEFKQDDLSSYGFKPIAANQVQNQQNVVSPLQNRPLPNQTPVPSLLDQAANSPTVGRIIAAGSGLRQGATDFAGDIGGFAADIIGAFDPEIAKGLRVIGNKAINYMDMNDVLSGRQKEQENHPIVASIGKGIGYTAGAMVAGAKVPQGVVPQVAANSLIGGAMAGPGLQNRLAGMASGAIIPLVAQKTLGSGATFLAANAAESEQVQKLSKKLLTSPVNPMDDIYTATNKAFGEFKTMPGKVNTARPVSKIDDFLKTSSKNLATPQLSLINELQSDVKAATNLEELHNARKAFTKDFDKVFLKGNNALYGKDRVAIIDLKNTVESNLQMNARQLGAIDQYHQANTLFKQSLEADKLSDVLQQASTGLGDANYITVAKKLQALQYKNPKAFSPETNKALDGIYKTIREAHTLFGVEAKNAGGITPIINAIGSLARTPVGKTIFVKIGGAGNTPQGRALLKNLTTSLVNAGINRGVLNPESFGVVGNNPDQGAQNAN